MMNSRKLSPNERMYLAFENNYNSFILNRIVEGKGDIKLDTFQKAVN